MQRKGVAPVTRELDDISYVYRDEAHAEAGIAAN